MNGKLIAVVLVGIGIGLAFPFFGNHQDAIAQQQEKATKWEYQVVYFNGDRGGDENTKRMNSLAAEKWEYVGFVGVIRQGPGNSEGGGFVAFKRQKQ